MTAMHLSHSAILAFGHMEEELSTTCRAAANALEILSNLRPGFTRNAIPRMNLTALSVSQPNNEDRQVNNEELSRTNTRRRQPQAVLFKLGLRPIASSSLVKENEGVFSPCFSMFVGHTLAFWSITAIW